MVHTDLVTASEVFFSSRRRHTRFRNVTGVQTCALPICLLSACAFSFVNPDELVSAHLLVRCEGVGDFLIHRNELVLEQDARFARPRAMLPGVHQPRVGCCPLRERGSAPARAGSPSSRTCTTRRALSRSPFYRSPRAAPPPPPVTSNA